MLGSDDIYNSLNVSGITAVLDTYRTKPAIFFGMMLPSDVKLEAKTINFYRYVPVDLSDTTQRYSYWINCRAKTFSEAESIAQAVITACNRKIGTDYFIQIKTMPIISPQDEKDNYNCPLEFIIFTNKTPF